MPGGCWDVPVCLLWLPRPLWPDRAWLPTGSRQMSLIMALGLPPLLLQACSARLSALPQATCWCPCLLEGPQARLGESGLPRSRGPHHGACSSEPPGARGSFPPFPAANGQEIHQHDAGLIQKPPADITFNGEMLTFAPKTETEARVSLSTT